MRIGSASGVDRAQLRAQRLDVRIDGAVAALQRIAPDAVHQLRARQHGAGPLQQRGQQAVFVAREVEPAPAVADAMAFGVVREAAARRRLGMRRARAAAPRARAPPVRAARRVWSRSRRRRVQARARARLRRACAVRKITGRSRPAAQFAAQREAADVRQADVEDRQVEGLRPRPRAARRRRSGSARPRSRPRAGRRATVSAMAVSSSTSRMRGMRRMPGGKHRHAPPGYPAPMNYRHAFHAGNHADVLKHVVLLALCDALSAKPTPLLRARHPRRPRAVRARQQVRAAHRRGRGRHRPAAGRGHRATR